MSQSSGCASPSMSSRIARISVGRSLPSQGSPVPEAGKSRSAYPRSRMTSVTRSPKSSATNVTPTPRADKRSARTRQRITCPAPIRREPLTRTSAFISGAGIRASALRGVGRLLNDVPVDLGELGPLAQKSQNRIGVRRRRLVVGERREDLAQKTIVFLGVERPAQRGEVLSRTQALANREFIPVLVDVRRYVFPLVRSFRKTIESFQNGLRHDLGIQAPRVRAAHRVAHEIYPLAAGPERTKSPEHRAHEPAV